MSTKRYYRAVLEDICLEGGIQKPTAVARYELREQLIDGEWVPIQPESIMGWHYLTKKNGDLNTMQLHQFKDAFGWDGTGLKDLLTFKGMDCQVTVDEETYQGKTRDKVQWINHYDYVPGKDFKTDESELAQMEAMLGPKLRAMGTSKPAAAPAAKAKAKSAPKAAPAPPAPPSTPPTTEPEDAPPNCKTMDDAWVVCCDKVHEDEQERVWFEIIGAVAPGKAVESITADEWWEIGARLHKHLPF